MKSKAKKALSGDRVERHKTGGGTFISQIDDIDDKILAILGNRAQPLVNMYDSDTLYQSTPVIYVQGEGTFPFQLKTVGAKVGDSVSLDDLQVELDGNNPLNNDDVPDTEQALTSQSAQPTIQRGPASQFAQPTIQLIDTIHQVPGSDLKMMQSQKPSTSTAFKVHQGRQWASAGRKRCLKKTDEREDAAAVGKISSLVDDKRVYYAALLDMRRIEHNNKLIEHGKKNEAHGARGEIL